MMTLHIQMFGSLSVYYQEKSVSSFPTHYVSELLGYLVLHPQKQHAREKLVDILWPECEIVKGRARLSTTLWRLRRAFKTLGVDPSHFLYTSRDWISWVPSRPYQSDLADFLDQMTLAHEARTSEIREAALKKAILLYTGEFCEGLFADWCLLERERLEWSYLSALSELMEVALDREDYLQAIDFGQTILQNDPLREEVHRALIFSYGRCGQLTNAIHQFQLCAHLLEKELGILPLPDTIEVYHQILAEGAACNLKDPLISNNQRQHILDAFFDFVRAGQQLQQMMHD